MSGLKDFDRERKRILWRLRLLTWGVWGAAVVVALAGGALVTWILSMGGLPFQPTWLIVSVLLLAIPGVLHLVFRRDQDGGEGPGPDVESDAGDRSGGEPERDPGGRPGGRPDDVPERDPGEEQ